MTTITIVGSKDAYVWEQNPDTNYNNTNLYAQKDPSSGWIRRSFIEFDLSALLDVPLEFMNTVTLQLRVLSVSDPETVDIRRIDNDTWTETGVTWNNQPTTTDYNIEEEYTTADTTIQTSIKSMLIDAVIDGHAYLGVSLKLLNESSAGLHYSRLASSDYATSAYRPQLIITYDAYSQTILYGSCCQNLTRLNGWGEVTMTDHNCPTGDAAEFTFKTQWGSSYTEVLLNVGDTEEYISGTKHHSFKLYSMSCNSAPCDNLAAATIEEKFWDTGHAYVKIGGDNNRHGRSWAEAWETITHAANEVFDGQNVRIGFGTYDSETDVTPDNASSIGIKYTPETADSGGGTGSVTINM